MKKEIEDRISRIEKLVQSLVLLHKEEFIDQYMGLWGTEHKSNPHADKEHLIRKLRDGSITYDESIRLQAILENERRKARDSGFFGAVLAISGLLILLAIFLDSLSEK